MSKHKKQHFIPRCYLKPWCDPLCSSRDEPYVWVLSKDGADCRKKSPENPCSVVGVSILLALVGLLPGLHHDVERRDRNSTNCPEKFQPGQGGQSLSRVARLRAYRGA